VHQYTFIAVGTSRAAELDYHTKPAHQPIERLEARTQSGVARAIHSSRITPDEHETACCLPSDARTVARLAQHVTRLLRRPTITLSSLTPGA